MSEENFKEAITDQYNDLYWDEDLLHDMYEAVTGEEKIRRFVTLKLNCFSLFSPLKNGRTHCDVIVWDCRIRRVTCYTLC